MKEMKEMKERVAYYDILRGGAILAVIAIHATGNMGDLYNSSKTSFHLAVIWRQIVGCAVPLFLALSGYFLSKKPVTSKKDYFNFLSKQIPRVYTPMLIWSLPLLGYILLFKDSNSVRSIVLFLVGGLSIYYFIALIIQYYLLLPFLQRIASKNGLIASVAISFLSLGVIFYLSNIKLLSIPLILYAGPFPVWLMFFVLGLWLGKNKIKTSTKMLFIFVLIGLFLSIAETYLIFQVTDSFQGLGIKIGAFVYSFALILLLFSLEFKPKPSNNYKLNVFNKRGGVIWNSMAYFGRISFGIYLIHMYVLSYISKPVYKLIGIENYFVEQLFLILFTLLVCVTGITITRKVNKEFAVKYLGF